MAAAGHNVFINPPGTRLKGKVKDGAIESLDVPDADVYVFQRVTSRLLVKAMEMLVDAGRRVIVDFDDDMRAVDPRNPAYHSVHTANPEVNWEHAMAASRVATCTTVASATLLGRYGHGRGALIRNQVPESFLKVEGVRHERTTIGWAGNLATHPGDPDVIRGGLAMALRDARHEGVDCRFVVVGDPTPGLYRAFGLEPSEPIESPGFVELENYPLVYAGLDVALAPLNDTVFNRSKSYLKAIEAAALGVPVVMSNLPEYAWLAKQGIGEIADRPRDWHRALRRLLVDSEHRAEVAALNRERAAAFTIERNLHLWEQAWLG